MILRTSAICFLSAIIFGVGFAPRTEAGPLGFCPRRIAAGVNSITTGRSSATRVRAANSIRFTPRLSLLEDRANPSVTYDFRAELTNASTHAAASNVHVAVHARDGTVVASGHTNVQGIFVGAGAVDSDFETYTETQYTSAYQYDPATGQYAFVQVPEDVQIDGQYSNQFKYAFSGAGLKSFTQVAATDFSVSPYAANLSTTIEPDFAITTDPNQVFTVPTFTGSLENVDHPIAVGTGGSLYSGQPQVNLYDAMGIRVAQIIAYPNWPGEVRVAMADFNGDGTLDVVTAPGPGGGPHVEIFDGKTGNIIFSQMVYADSFSGGVTVAAGDVNGDGRMDLITGAGAGGGPHVKVFDTQTATTLYSFFAYEATFTGGVNVASGDTNRDGYADVVTAPESGGGPRVRDFSGKNLVLLQDFVAFNAPDLRTGINVAVGDLNGDGNADIIVGAGFRGGPRSAVYDGAVKGKVDADFFAYDSGFRGGVRVGFSNGTILVAAGPTGGPHVKVLDRFGVPNFGFFNDTGLISDAVYGLGVFVGGN